MLYRVDTMVVQESKSTKRKFQSWKSTIGRVAFRNCDPLFLTIDQEWNVISAPPSWLTGHLLRRDCILAPIPAADYAKHSDELILVPDLGICSKGEVGSVILFGKKPLDEMKSIALPSDSSSSVALMKYIISVYKLSPTLVVMGPDINQMLESCDGALIIGDRALNSAKNQPDLVVMDLGLEWQKITGKPMVFGVFAARKDTPVQDVKIAYKELLSQLVKFETDYQHRSHVIELSAMRSNLPLDRMERYFGEVFNRLDNTHVDGLQKFLQDVCNLNDGAEFLW